MSWRSELEITTSSGVVWFLSSTKSPSRDESFSEYTGVSREISSREMFSRSDTCSRSRSSFLAIMSGLRDEELLALEVLAHLLDLDELVGPVQRQADHPRLLADGLQDGLADPPHGVGDEVVALLHVEALDGVHEPDVALADEVRERKALVLVLLGHVDDEAEVRPDQLLLGQLLVLRRPPRELLFLLPRQERDLVDFLEVQGENVLICPGDLPFFLPIMTAVLMFTSCAIV